MCRLKIILFLFSIYFLQAQGQYLSAFHNFRNSFFIFDNGVTRQVEYLPSKSFKIGGNSVGYIDNMGNFKAYYNGDITLLSENTPEEYTATDYLLTYKITGNLLVFDRGKRKNLSVYCDHYSTGDSIVAFVDENKLLFNAYYNNAVVELEPTLTRSSTHNFKTGDNIIAYVSYINEFKIFYHNQVIRLEINEPVNYEADRNLVAYVDSYSGTFKAFHKGKSFTLEGFEPLSYKTGNDLIAYVDNTNHFKVFYEGNIFPLLSYAPSFYKTEDDLVVYGDGTIFNVFYKGQNYTLENFIPTSYETDNNMLVYPDPVGFLKMFDKGTVKPVTKEVATQFEVIKGVLKYNTSHNSINFYYNNKYLQY